MCKRERVQKRERKTEAAERERKERGEKVERGEGTTVLLNLIIICSRFLRLNYRPRGIAAK